jgi:hypothetical protein
MHPLERQLKAEQLSFSINKWAAKRERELLHKRPNPRVRYAFKDIKRGKFLYIHTNAWDKTKSLVASIYTEDDNIYMVKTLEEARYIRKNGQELLKCRKGNLIGHGYNPKSIKIVKVKLSFKELKK